MISLRIISLISLFVLIGCTTMEKGSTNKVVIYFNEMFSLEDLRKYFSISVDQDKMTFSKAKQIQALSADLPLSRHIPDEFYESLKIIGRTESGLYGLQFVDISPDKSWISVKNLFYLPNSTGDRVGLYCVNLKNRIVKKYQFGRNCYFSEDSKRAFIEKDNKYIEMNLDDDKILSSVDEVESIVLSSCRRYLFFMKENSVHIVDVYTGMITKGSSYRNRAYDSGIINNQLGYFMTHRSYKMGPTELYLIDFKSHNVYKYPYRIRESFVVFPSVNSGHR